MFGTDKTPFSEPPLPPETFPNTSLDPIISETAATDAFAKDSVAFAETAARFYGDLAARLRRETVKAHAMDIAGMVLMSDHYKARAMALKSFVHAVQCYPTFAMLARTHKVRL